MSTRVVVYGKHGYGRVHAHGGEYAETAFLHVQFVPLIPLQSWWVTSDVPGRRRGFEIPLHIPSIAATYLRVWAPILAVVACVGGGSAIGVAIGAALVAASAWSWTWRTRRDAWARRRSDFDCMAFGSRCDPAWMAAAMRDELERALTLRLRRREEPRPADEVARCGARDLDEAMIAYGSLRLRGATRPAARRAAERLVCQVAASQSSSAMAAATRAYAVGDYIRAQVARARVAASRRRLLAR